MDFMGISSLLGQGFFADKVVDVLHKTGPISANDESVLRRVKSFLNTIAEGQKEATAERLSSSTLERIDAYQKALTIFSQAILHSSETMTAAKFQKLMDEMVSEVELILNKKEVTGANITLDFFKYVQKQTADETSEYITERAVLKWPIPATFCKF